MDRPSEQPEQPAEPEEPAGPEEPAAPAPPPAEPESPYGAPPPIPPAPEPVEAQPRPSLQPEPPLPPGDEGAAPVKETRPGIWAGVGTGCGLHFIGIILMITLLGTIGSIWGWIWPFIAIPVIAGALMFSRTWRRFATGILIVSAATWIVVIGPCVGIIAASMNGI
ncbi:hypothetical protein [Microbacterium sp. 2FI]|uniref:hypothetical protein n=1 Tax=Microbacterium sp. 2FI TaxID=2502193 RepID=UPI0010F74E97|nr:hypothetical protein [Microbacterium sp. 2FI]